MKEKLASVKEKALAAKEKVKNEQAETAKKTIREKLLGKRSQAKVSKSR